MTGITQTPQGPGSPRPSTGIASLGREESAMQRRLAECQVELMVENLWDKHSPQHIAGLIRARYPQSMMFITARWVESIHQRLTKRRSLK